MATYTGQYQDEQQESLLNHDVERHGGEAEITEEKPAAQPQESHGKRSTAFLDGLRGVAALCVFSGHMMGGGDHDRGFGDLEGGDYLISLPFIRVLYSGGPAAVAVFFVLSGFVVTQTMVKLLQRHEQQEGFLRAWASAMVRRPIRLYLPCWAIVLLTALALHLPYNIYPAVPWLEARESIQVELARVIKETANYFWPFKHHASDQSWFIYGLVMWTIPIELKGSFLCYGLVGLYALANRSFGSQSPIHIWAVSTLMISVTILLQLGHWWPACFIAGYAWSILEVHALDKPLLSHNFAFDVGHHRRNVPVKTIAVHLILVLSWYLLGAPATSGRPEWSLTAPGWYWLTKMIPTYYNKDLFYRYWQSWGAIGFVYATLRIPWLQHFFNTRPLRYLGKVSFMLYLIHLPIAYCFSDRWIRVFGHTPYGSDSRWWDNLLWLPDWGAKGLNLRWFASYGSVLAINLCIAGYLTRLLDEPSVRLGKHVSGLMGLNQPPKQAPILGVPA